VHRHRGARHPALLCGLTLPDWFLRLLAPPRERAGVRGAVSRLLPECFTPHPAHCATFSPAGEKERAPSEHFSPSPSLPKHPKSRYVRGQVYPPVRRGVFPTWPPIPFSFCPATASAP